MVAEAAEEFACLYMTCGSGANKYVHFFKAWLQYMLTYTGDQLSDSSSALWEQLAQSYPDSISSDTKGYLLCEILHSLQRLLQRELLTELEDSHELSGALSGRGGDDKVLCRIGGWAMHTATKFRSRVIEQGKGNATALKKIL